MKAGWLMRRKINLEVLLQLSVFFGMAILLLGALWTGKIRYYVHPRLDGYLWFAVIALGVIGGFVSLGLFRPKHKLHLTPYWMLLFPMAAAVVFPAVTVDNPSLELSYGGSVVTGQIGGAGRNDGAYDWSTAGEPFSPLWGKSSDLIVVNDDDFAAWYMDTYEHMKDYNGKKVQLKGQVFRINAFKDDQFVLMRRAMVCCAADVQPIGFLCVFDDAHHWKDDQWILVTAVIRIEEYQGEMMPALYATDIIPAEQPVNEYVYFY